MDIVVVPEQSDDHHCLECNVLKSERDIALANNFLKTALGTKTPFT